MIIERTVNGDPPIRSTIVQVTHSEANAACGHRLIDLADGWVVSAGSDLAGKTA